MKGDAVPPDLSLVMVAFGSSTVVPGAVRSFREEAARAGVGSEVVVVDHSEDDAEAERLLSARPDRLIRNPNRGYAAGLNAGFAASRGSVVMGGNPDIRFEERSIAALLEALRAGWHVVGPQLTLGPLLYPPPEEQHPAAEWGRWLAHRGRPLQRWWWHRELRRNQRVWQAADPVPQTFLGGALLAAGRDVWHRIGPWDESYFLYFEEMDWLVRANRAGFRAAIVPRARVEHHWGHAASPARTAGHFHASRRRYLAGRFGPIGRFTARYAVPGPWRWSWPALPEGPVNAPGEEVLWLISPLAVGVPSLAARAGRSVPRDALDLVLGSDRGIEELTVAAVAGGRRLGCWRWRRPGAESPREPAVQAGRPVREHPP